MAQPERSHSEPPPLRCSSPIATSEPPSTSTSHALTTPPTTTGDDPAPPFYHGLLKAKADTRCPLYLALLKQYIQLTILTHTRNGAHTPARLRRAMLLACHHNYSLISLINDEMRRVQMRLARRRLRRQRQIRGDDAKEEEEEEERPLGPEEFADTVLGAYARDMEFLRVMREISIRQIRYLRQATMDHPERGYREASARTVGLMFAALSLVNRQLRRVELGTASERRNAEEKREIGVEAGGLEGSS